MVLRMIFKNKLSDKCFKITVITVTKDRKKICKKYIKRWQFPGEFKCLSALQRADENMGLKVS